MYRVNPNPNPATPSPRAGSDAGLDLSFESRGDHLRRHHADTAAWLDDLGRSLAFTRYCFTYTRLCTSQSSFHSSGAPALPTLLQYYCTAIGQYTTPLDLPLVCHTPYNVGNNNIVQRLGSSFETQALVDRLSYVCSRAQFASAAVECSWCMI